MVSFTSPLSTHKPILSGRRQSTFRRGVTQLAGNPLRKYWGLKLPIYQYKCANCDSEFESMRPMAECEEDGKCPQCGLMSRKIFSAPHDHWGFTLSEASHHKGNRDELVSRRPSNDRLIRG